MTKIINPLDLVSTSSDPVKEAGSDASLESKSSVCNETHGVCPKCGDAMSTSNIPTPKFTALEPVFWCGSCKVATPKPL